MAAAGVMLLMVRVGDYLVAGFMVFACQKLLQSNDTSDQERDLGEEDSLGSSEGDDAEEQRNEGGDLELGKSKEGQELLDLLFLATSCNHRNENINMCKKTILRAKNFNLSMLNIRMFVN